MTEYKVGQRVRVEVEGIVSWAKSHHPDVQVKPINGGDPLLFEMDGSAEITVLSEPRPDEPKGLGAVVEAGSPYDGQRYPYVRTPGRVGGDDRWYRATGMCSMWESLIDPVVLREGWTP